MCYFYENTFAHDKYEYCFAYKKEDEYCLDIIILSLGENIYLIFWRQHESLNANLLSVPIEQNHKMNYEEKNFKEVQYQRLEGKLIYLTHTRPNLTIIVNMVSQSMHDIYKLLVNFYNISKLLRERVSFLK